MKFLIGLVLLSVGGSGGCDALNIQSCQAQCAHGMHSYSSHFGCICESASGAVAVATASTDGGTR